MLVAKHRSNWSGKMKHVVYEQQYNSRKDVWLQKENRKENLETTLKTLRKRSHQTENCPNILEKQNTGCLC